MPRIRKIKGGLNVDYANRIRDLNNPNNLKSLDELKKLKVLKEIDGLEGGLYFIDETGNIITDPISLENIEYEDAFLFQNIFLYDINVLYDLFYNKSYKKNPETKDNISDNDLEKTSLFFRTRFKLNETTQDKLKDLSNFNNLKTFEELFANGLLKLYDGEYYFVDDNHRLIKDKFSKKPIRYKHGILIDDHLYDINSLTDFTHFKSDLRKTFKKVHNEEISNKVRDFYENYVLLYAETPEKLKPLILLKQLGLADSNGFLIHVNDKKIEALNLKKGSFLRYEDAVLKNGMLLYNTDKINPPKKKQRTMSDEENSGGGKCNNKYLKNIKELNKLKPFKELKKAGILKYVKINENEGYLFIKCRN